MNGGFVFRFDLFDSMPSCREIRAVSFFNFPSSMNEGLKAGAEGFVTSRCCEELSIWKVGEELFSILTETSPPERCLILIATLISINTTTNVGPDPMRGHLKLSNRVGSLDLAIGFC